MKKRLRIHIEKKEGEEERSGYWNTSNPFLTIGSSSSCHIQLEDPDVKPIHFRLKTIGDSLFVVNLSGNSTRGSLHGSNIRRKVNEGDLLKAGPYRITLGEASEEGETVEDGKNGIFPFLRRNWKEVSFYTVSVLLHLMLFNIIVFQREVEEEKSIEAQLNIPATALNDNREAPNRSEEEKEPVVEEKEKKPDEPETPKTEEEEKKKPDQKKPQRDFKARKALQGSMFDDSLGLQGKPSQKQAGKGTSGGGTGNIFKGGGGGRAKWLVFCIDVSGSMGRDTVIKPGELQSGLNSNLGPNPSRLSVVQHELIHFIRGLKEEQNFNVIFFSSRPRSWEPSKMVSATARNKEEVIPFINRQIPDGNTNMFDTLKLAYSYINTSAPETIENGAVIYFLSDGRPSNANPYEIVELVRRKSEKQKIKINVIGIDSGGKEFMKQMAEASGGYFKNYGRHVSNRLENLLARVAQIVKDQSMDLTAAEKVLKRILKRPKVKKKQLTTWLFRQARRCMRNARYNQAGRFRQLLIQAFPDSTLARKIRKKYLTEIIRHLLNQGQHNISTVRSLIKKHEKYLSKFPDLPNLILEWARYYGNKNARGPQKKLLAIITDLFSETDIAHKAKEDLDRLANETAYKDLNMANNYQMNDMYKQAIKLYKKVLKGRGSERVKKKAKEGLKQARKKAKR